MSLHGLGVIGAQVAASIKSNDEKHPAAPRIHSPTSSIQSTPVPEIQPLTESPHREFDPSIGAKPYSPFYAHGSPTLSHEHLTLETAAANHTHSRLRDLENAGPYLTGPNDGPRRSKLWEAENPPQGWFHSLTTRQKMALKVVIAIVTIGTMIAIALGITSAVGGALWRSKTESADLG
ncbi:hypothetical protein N7492_009250 [Penicillium capsulatum]|uniref:Uncharacterized protein n=1 Tax=Penicillium capsulatum TaxID=69766 RepID=A0A9W9LHW4_9EURO|nr:hypothetical protein N7492_009250 [Penicillium capsulatum]KAJ6106644.1 hypothetical protein N7512_010161 [Penicillium capsulatum]